MTVAISTHESTIRKINILNNCIKKCVYNIFSDKTGMKIVLASGVRKMVKLVKAPVLVEINGKEIQHPEAYILHSEPGKDIVTITGTVIRCVASREELSSFCPTRSYTATESR